MTADIAVSNVATWQLRESQIPVKLRQIKNDPIMSYNDTPRERSSTGRYQIQMFKSVRNGCGWISASISVQD